MVEFDVERVRIRFSPHNQQTEVLIRFDDEDVRRMDRQQFRRLLSERLNQAGDALMHVWSEMHEEKACE